MPVPFCIFSQSFLPQPPCVRLHPPICSSPVLENGLLHCRRKDGSAGLFVRWVSQAEGVIFPFLSWERRLAFAVKPNFKTGVGWWSAVVIVPSFGLWRALSRSLWSPCGIWLHWPPCLASHFMLDSIFLSPPLLSLGLFPLSPTAIHSVQLSFKPAPISLWSLRFPYLSFQVFLDRALPFLWWVWP